jgi:hypothetical protein
MHASEFIAERMWPEAPVERSIFGTGDPERIWEQVLDVCPEAVECFAFEVSVGALFGLRLRDRSQVALKIHRERDTAALEAVQRVQAYLVERRFPCPRPLGVRGIATLERWFDDGVYRDAHNPAVRGVVACYLARLFPLTRKQPLAGFEPFFPPADGPLWPVPHNVLFDFEATAAGAEWIDEIAWAAKPLRDPGAAELVIGHGDWTVNHFRFASLRPTVVYDWDSLNIGLETVFVGNSAASFTYTGHLPVEIWPTPSEAQAFLAEYERERGRPFTPDERRGPGAAGGYAPA